MPTPTPPPEPEPDDDVLADVIALGAAAGIIHNPDADPEVVARVEEAAGKIAAKHKRP